MMSKLSGNTSASLLSNSANSTHSDMHHHRGSAGANSAQAQVMGSNTPNASATSPNRTNHLTYQHGHSFVKKTFHKPTNCHYCGELLWGLMGQGYICEGNCSKTIYYH
jgi:hypothetical protein